MSHSYTLQEIRSQAITLEKTKHIVMNQSLAEHQKDCFLFIGCGTSYYLAIAAARYFQETTGLSAHAVPASEVFLNPNQVFSPRFSYQLIAISRSGTTSEIVQALKSVQGNKSISAFAVTCHRQAEIVKLAEESFVLDHVEEKSVVMTQSFTNMLYALQLYALRLAKCDAGELLQVPKRIEKVLEDTKKMQEIAADPNSERFIFLGTGSTFGLAEEGCLKLKEMTQTECEAYGALEFRHGPISMVDEKTVVILLSSQAMKGMEEPLIADIRSFGGKTIVLGTGDPVGADQVINFLSLSLDESSMVCVMPYLQMLAYYRAIHLGLDPDQPRNLNQVVKISFSS